jgi:hypothetical protein
MKTAVCTLESVSPYGASRHFNVPKLNGELHDDYEKRTWRERGHWTQDGRLFIPPMAFKNCLASAAKYLGMKIPGQGSKTFTKKFEAGVLVTDALVLPDKKEDFAENGEGNAYGLWLFVPSDGVRGGGKRVDRCFPCVRQWAGEVTFHILDDIITEESFGKHLEVAGSFIGVGFFRPQSNGYFGRFRATNVQFS